MATAIDNPTTVRAQAKWVRMSARKARLVLDLVRGRTVPEARTVLAFTPRAAAREIDRVLAAAVAPLARRPPRICPSVRRPRYCISHPMSRAVTSSIIASEWRPLYPQSRRPSLTSMNLRVSFEKSWQSHLDRVMYQT